MKTKADEIFRQIRSQGLYNHMRSYEMISDRIAVIDEATTYLNSAKAHVTELDMEHPGTASHLLFLLQEDSGISLGFCPYYKMWTNRNGDQHRCRFNRGPVQTPCLGKVEKCVHETEYEIAQKAMRRREIRCSKIKQHD